LTKKKGLLLTARALQKRPRRCAAAQERFEVPKLEFGFAKMESGFVKLESGFTKLD